MNVTEIEELQTIKNKEALDKLFTRAKATVVGGGTVVLVRRHADGRCDPFDTFTTEDDLEQYRKNIYKYLV